MGLCHFLCFDFNVNLGKVLLSNRDARLMQVKVAGRGAGSIGRPVQPI
jgi:hypothetical protein